jgi:hypothetical protein
MFRRRAGGEILPLPESGARKESAMARRADVRRVAERPYWREDEARVLVEAWRGSGEMLEPFAQRLGVERRRLARWVSRLERGADEGAVCFHPVRLLEQQAEPERSGSGARIEIELAHGRRVSVPRGFEAEDLRRVLAVLGDVAAC